MSATGVRHQVPDIHDSPADVNNFSIMVATVNGSGSQTANNALIRALFKMGIPVSGKNIFPSNIEGLPTWFNIRVSEEGFVGRRDSAEIVVAMNRATAQEDIAQVPPGGVLLYPLEWKLTEERPDITYYSLPVLEMAKASAAAVTMRPYVANMVYVGALAQLLGIELAEIEAALLFHFKGKRGPVDLNFDVVKKAAEYVRATHQKRDKFSVRRINKTADKIMINGNEAGALGAVFGGFTVAAWYPITPSTSLVDSLSAHAAKLRTDKETGTKYYTIVQAEDEIAALGMVVGAGWMGARALTSTSGPGISLMTEYAGFAYFTDIPCVIWDIQRMGPSTGLPTRTAQGDVLKIYYLGHGDMKHVILLPGNMEECFEFGWHSFDLAERLQTPVFVLSDLDLGMNLWMSQPFAYPDKPMDRGKVLSKEDLDRLGAEGRTFQRYADDGVTGVGPRTLPGTDHPRAAYFVRGSGHNADAKYTERPDEWQANLVRLRHKHDYARTIVPGPVVDESAGAEIGIISYGSNDVAIAEARHMLAGAGVRTDYMRLRALPISDEVKAFIAKHPQLYVVENNFDGQMHNILMTETPQHAAKLASLCQCDGLPLTARWIAQSIVEKER